MKKVKTMDLKGNRYAKVVDRLKAFHEDYPNGYIELSKEYEDGVFTVQAKIFIDKGQFRGNAFALTGGKVNKGLEKAQTVALGKALGYIGYYGDGEIASFEEAEEYQHETNKEDKYNKIAK